MAAPEIERLIDALARLPGFGPRSARRAALHCLRQPDRVMVPLADALTAAHAAVGRCSVCNMLDVQDPCGVCSQTGRNPERLCVVEDVADVWALERAGAHDGYYHVLDGLLSAVDGVGPKDLGMDTLIQRAGAPAVSEVILALDATVDGETTAHVLSDALKGSNVSVTRLAYGLPMGGELDYLDDGTLALAVRARRAL